MRFGYFDEKNREYVITRPDTPTPWVNYIGGGEYGGIISNNAGGTSFDKDPRFRRVLRYRFNAIPEDQPGRYIYLLDQDSKKFWSSTWQPTKDKLDFYECRHGLSYTKISAKKDDIKSEVTYFVPLNDSVELWTIKVKNESAKSRNLRLFSYAEFSFYDAMMDVTNIDWVQQIGQGYFKNNTIIISNFMKNIFYFMSANGKISGFDSSRDSFLGPLGDYKNPIALTNGKSADSPLYRGNGIGSISCDIILAPGEEKELTYLVGSSEKENNIKKIVEKYKNPEATKEEYLKLKKYWQDFLSKFQVNTPDSEMNLMVNTWNQYQCRSTFNWSRFISMYQLGYDRGMGFRDSAQDTLGVMHVFPKECKIRILKLLLNQFPSGDTYHQYYPLTGKGEGKGFSDDHLWIILAVAGYIKETGDFKILSESVAYADSKEKGSVLDHLKRAIEFSMKNIGPHKIPLAGVADWNDTVNIDHGKKKAESVWVAIFLLYALNELIGILKASGRNKETKIYENYYKQLSKNINKSCWDGKWYRRYFTEDGEWMGSNKCRKGKIFLNAQSWAVMSGLIRDDKAKKLLDVTAKLMNTKYGLVLVAPSFDKFEPKYGGLTTYPPGAKENGGIFLHSNPWMMIAETIIGRGDIAHKYYRQILPPTRNDIAEIFKAEPYVYCQNILGPEHPLFGLGRNSWLTGTASWNFIAASNHILGIRADYSGLIIDPCIPKNWKSFKAKRIFRGSIYEIEVKNESGISKGVKKLIIDGKEISGNTAPIFKDKSTHKVIAIM